MKTRSRTSDVLLLLTAAIWGFAFVAQRHAMLYMGPAAFNGLRFALGALSLVPLLVLEARRGDLGRAAAAAGGARPLLRCGLLAGGALFFGSVLQQAGVVHTTAGKAGFVTGAYVVLVPLVGALRGHATRTGTWVGAGLACAGLWFLCLNESLRPSFGDFLVLLSALFYTAHVLLIDAFAGRVPVGLLSVTQYLGCAALSLVTAALTETTTLDGVRGALPCLLYGGLASVGVAYTLQVIAQKDAHPAHAAIIMCMESPCAALGGWLVLSEQLTSRALLGCALMLAGMLTSQLWTAGTAKPPPGAPNGD